MPSHDDRRYAVGHFALPLDESPTRVRKLGILIGLLLFLLLFLFLLAFLLFGPGGDVRSFFDVFLPGDPTFVVRSPPGEDVVIFGDGVGGKRLPDANMPYCEQVMVMQDKLGGSFFDVFFDVFFWANKTRLMVGSNPLCGGDPDGITQPASNPGTSSGGHCQDKCDPSTSDCLAGLKCQPSKPGSTDFICWDQAICTTPIQVEVTDQATEAKGCGNGVCDPGESVYTCTPDCGEPPSDGDDKNCKCVNGVLSCNKAKKC